MESENPLAVVTPTLDAAVLRALAATTGAATGAHVHRMAGAGSPDGVRRVLARLVLQGIVLAEDHAHATLYRLNRDHVATDAILELTRLKGKIVDRIRGEIDEWTLSPLHASLFGSFARGDGDVDSDIDILLVAPTSEINETGWAEQVDALARHIQLWTGNMAQALDTTPETVQLMLRGADPLIESWRADAVHLAGLPLLDLLRQLRTSAGLELERLR